MEKLTISETARALCAEVYGQTRGFIQGVTIDSRGVKENDLFLPIVGARTDGHAYIGKAWESGASTSLIRRDRLMMWKDRIPEGKTLLAVDDTEAALEVLAEAYRSRFDIPVVGVTGSVGKTSCKEFVASALSGGRKVLKTEGNHNNNIGMPLSVFGLDSSVQAAVFEMGMDHFGEIHRLSRVAKPRIGIITNIGISHMENLGSREGILKAKLEIADYLQPDGVLFLNGDDERLYALKGHRKENLRFFGRGEHNDGRIERAEVTADGKLDFEGSYEGRRYRFLLDTPGRHMAYNVMPALMTALYLGLDEEEIRQGLSSYVTPERRLRVHKTETLTVLDDCYNASPDSTEAALETLMAIPGNGRRVAILGDMLELGAMQEEGHRRVGRAAARLGVSALFCIGPLSSLIAEEAKKGGVPTEEFRETDELLKNLVGKIRKGDIILVKASRSMALERIADALLKL